MAKESKRSYVVNMDVDISKIKDLPEGSTPAKLFYQTVILAIITAAKQAGGLTMQDQRRLYSLRNVFENALAINETVAVEVEHDDFKFLLRTWEQQRQEATYNEQIIITENRIKEAEALYLKG